jgi:hypothetical protein
MTNGKASAKWNGYRLTIKSREASGCHQEQPTTNAGEAVGKGTLLRRGWERKLVQLLWKAVWRSLKELKELPYDPATPLLHKALVCTTQFYSAIKKNKITLFAGKRVELENFMLSKVSQAQTNQRSHFPHMWKLDLLVKFTYRNM